MKKLIILLLLFAASCTNNTPTTHESFSTTLTQLGVKINFGENPGYYAQYQTAFGGPGSADSIYELMYRVGCRSMRVSVAYNLYEQFGTFSTQFQFASQKLGFTNNTFFLDVAEAPYNHRDTMHLSNGAQTWLPKGLYLPELNSDSTVNVNNAWAKYAYDMVMANGAFITHWEVWNEPDLNNTPDSYTDSNGSATSWQKTEPKAINLVNLNATVADYVQLCKVAYHIVHKFAPAGAIVATGGTSNPWFYNWFLKKGGGNYVDELSMHFYPIYSLTYYPNTNRRNSNYAVFRTDSNYLLLNTYETLNGVAHKPIQYTEVNINRWSRPGNASALSFPNNKEFGSDAIQRNFDLKIILKEFQRGVKGFHFFATMEAADSGDQSNVNYSMGLYKNGNKAGTIGQEASRKTQAGIGTTALQSLTQNYYVQPTILNITGVDGVVLDSAGSKMYAVWDNNMTVDTSENHSTSYTLPAGNYRWNKWDGTYLGTVSGTVTVTMDPSYFTLVGSGTVTPPPDTIPIPPPVTPPPDTTTVIPKTVTGIKLQVLSSRQTRVQLFYADGSNKTVVVAKGLTYEVTYTNNGKPYASVQFSDGSIVTYQ